jgi:hypothetical protein
MSCEPQRTFFKACAAGESKHSVLVSHGVPPAVPPPPLCPPAPAPPLSVPPVPALEIEVFGGVSEQAPTCASNSKTTMNGELLLIK